MLKYQIFLMCTRWQNTDRQTDTRMIHLLCPMFIVLKHYNSTKDNTKEKNEKWLTYGREKGIINEQIAVSIIYDVGVSFFMVAKNVFCVRIAKPPSIECKCRWLLP